MSLPSDSNPAQNDEAVNAQLTEAPSATVAPDSCAGEDAADPVAANSCAGEDAADPVAANSCAGEDAADPVCDDSPKFTDFPFSKPILRALQEAQFVTPTSIQQEAIPLLLQGRDLIGQARTGTGKTAAFALPILQKVDLKQPCVQALILAPTRELAVQICEAIRVCAQFMPRLHVAALYGGQPIPPQETALKRGVQIVVGTPGRVIDHLKRKSLQLDHLDHFVLDEADEMLKMGFIEDVEWILDQVPTDRPLQKALFSATMPSEVRAVAEKRLVDPAFVHVDGGELTLPTIEQRYLLVHGHDKLFVLCRLLEAESAHASLIFTRTKQAAGDLADALEERGFIAEPLHGDMSQAHRERVVDRLRRGKVDVVVATDVAARGLDIEGLTHVINYDIPIEPELYLHRIGRTGRAGREGIAILFVRPRERDLLRQIEQFTHCRIEPMSAPTAEEIGRSRTELFKTAIRNQMQSDDLEFFRSLIRKMVEEGDDMLDAAAGLARLAQLHRPLQLPPDPVPIASGKIELIQLSAGRIHGIRVNDVVGALANEAGIPGPMIGAITICDRDTFVELPQNFVNQALQELATLRSYPIRCRIAPTNIQPRSGRPGHQQGRPGFNPKAPRGKQGDQRSPREPREPQDARESREPHEFRELKERRDNREPREICEIERFRDRPRKDEKPRSAAPKSQAHSEFHGKGKNAKAQKPQKRDPSPHLNRRHSPR